MIKKLLFILLPLFTVNIAKAQFSPVLPVDSLTTERVTQIACADFNSDGLNDILVSAEGFPFDKMILFTNLGGNDFSQQMIASVKEIRSFDCADLDNNGRTDFVVSYGQSTSQIVWYINGPGGFVADTVDAGLDFTSKILLRDFDHNGNADILSLQHTEIVLYLATGTAGLFNTGVVIHDSTEFYAIDAADYNNDGNLDVSVASGGFEVLLNDGAGNFTWHSQAGFLLSFGLQSGDIDSDNDVDIVVYEAAIGLVSYANNGSGNFSLYDTVLDNSDDFKIYGITDLDCDSDPDIYTSLGQLRQLITLENDGSGHFAAPVIVHTENGSLLYATTAADMNNDSKSDLAWGAYHVGVHFNQCSALSVEELNEQEVLVFPNPANDHVNIRNTGAAELYFTLYDVTGRKQASLACPSAGTVAFQLPAAGMYLLEGFTVEGKRVVSEKIIR